MSGFGSAAKQLDPKNLTNTAKSLRDAPIMKSTAGKASDLMEKAAATNELERFGTAASIIGTTNSAYGAGKAIFGKSEGDGMDRAADITKGLMDLGESSVDTASRFTSKITDKSLERLGSYNTIAKGSLDLINTGRHGFMASTDNIMAQNAVRSIRNESSNRTSQKERANDRTAEALLNSQQHTAGVHKAEALQQGIHAGLDVASGAAQFIPGVGKTISTGIGAVQTASDFVLNQEVEHRKNVGREANLGQERMDMLRTLTEKLVAERKAQYAAEGRSFTMFDADECQKLAKHTVNQKLYGEGARTNRMASLKKTNADVTSMEQLMQQRGTDAEGELAAKRMIKAGHAIGDDGSFVDKNESLAKFNADFNGKSFEETYGAAESNEDSKYHLVHVARAKARKNAEEKAAKKAEKARLKAMTPEERKAAKAESKEAKAQAKEQAKLAKAQAKADKERNKGARAAQKQARREARKEYRTDRNRYVAKEMDSEENQSLGFFGRIAQKHRLKKAFDKANEAKGVENAAEGTASAGRRNPIKEMVLHAKRSHDRARDSIVNEGFDKLGAFDRFKIAAANPLALIASKTASGKAKSDPSRRASGEQHSAALLDEIMGAGSAPEPAPASAPEVQEGAADGDQMADPYLLSVQDKVDRFNSGHANNDKVDPSKLSFKNKIRHLNRRRR